MKRFFSFNFKFLFLASYGTQISPMFWDFELVDIGFTFKYFDSNYTQVSISSFGYVCLGYNSKCGSTARPSPHDCHRLTI
jgi:hypothetical protein